MINILEKKLLEEDYTSLDLAAALLKMMMGEENEDIIDTREPRSLDELDSYYRGENRNGNGRGRGRNEGGRRIWPVCLSISKEPECEAWRYPGSHRRRVRNAGQDGRKHRYVR